jgi:hypothetical protein
MLPHLPLPTLRIKKIHNQLNIRPLLRNALPALTFEWGNSLGVNTARCCTRCIPRGVVFPSMITDIHSKRPCFSPVAYLFFCHHGLVGCEVLGDSSALALITAG